jgi:nitrogen fixation NifU-like protein
MPINDPYNEEVRALFENPVHASDLCGEYAEAVTADVSESDQGARLVLAAGIEAGAVARIRFRAFGCPHLVAAAELLCRELEGGPVSGLSMVSVKGWMNRLSVPVAKTGRLLLIEDAVRILRSQLDGAG